jgi:hypothetical protein
MQQKLLAVVRVNTVSCGNAIAAMQKIYILAVTVFTTLTNICL